MRKQSEFRENELKKLSQQPVKKPDHKSTFVIKEKTRNLTPSSVILDRIDSEMDKISLQNPAENVRIYNPPDQMYPLYTQDMDALKKYLNTDVLYYDYETSNLMKLNESKNPSNNNVYVQNNQKQINNGQLNKSSPSLSSWKPKSARFEDFNEELIKSQKNLYQIADFQEKIIQLAMDEVCQPRGKFSSSEKNDLNIPRSKMSNVQSLIVPNQGNSSFEAEKFKRNI